MVHDRIIDRMKDTYVLPIYKLPVSKSSNCSTIRERWKWLADLIRYRIVEGDGE